MPVRTYLDIRPPFRDRTEGGRALAEAFRARRQPPPDDAVVLGLPRGGVPVAFEVARQFSLALDVFVVRKLGVPGHEELGMGAIASGGTRVLTEEIVRELGITEAEVEAETQQELRELERREALYRDGRPPVPVAGHTAILVDDGLATGASMHAAVEALRTLDPARVLVGVPVAAPETCGEFAEEVDEVVCAATPEPFRAVGLWYRNFEQTTDEEVRRLLARAREWMR